MSETPKDRIPICILPEKLKAAQREDRSKKEVGPPWHRALLSQIIESETEILQ